MENNSDNASENHNQNSFGYDHNSSSALLDPPKSFPSKSSPITIPLRSSPHNYTPNIHIKSKSLSPQKISSSKQSIDSNTDLISSDENFPLNETKKNDSSFYQELSIHLEQPVGSMSISPSSRDIVLAAYVFLLFFF